VAQLPLEPVAVRQGLPEALKLVGHLLRPCLRVGLQYSKRRRLAS
jgi:hypothetical protein